MVDQLSGACVVTVGSNGEVYACCGSVCQNGRCENVRKRLEKQSVDVRDRENGWQTRGGATV